MNFYLQTLPPDTAELVAQLHLKRPVFLESFYLSGGTGLSLQIGHRQSEDLDFFSKQPFDALALVKTRMITEVKSITF